VGGRALWTLLDSESRTLFNAADEAPSLPRPHLFLRTRLIEDKCWLGSLGGGVSWPGLRSRETIPERDGQPSRPSKLCPERFAHLSSLADWLRKVRITVNEMKAPHTRRDQATWGRKEERSRPRPSHAKEERARRSFCYGRSLLHISLVRACVGPPSLLRIVMLVRPRPISCGKENCHVRRRSLLIHASWSKSDGE